jgi:hypothetical protein
MRDKVYFNIDKGKRLLNETANKDWEREILAHDSY